MIETIISVLHKLGADAWLLRETAEETAELFFVKKQLDTRRIKNTHKCKVTLYRDSEQGETKLRGSTDVELTSSDTVESIERKLADAYFAAQFAMNPWYALPEGIKAPCKATPGALTEKPLSESVGVMTEALFAADTREDAFLNSAELFLSRRSVRILSSEGTDVSYTDADVSGEFVVQCRTGEDVEMFHQFSYKSVEPEALTKKVAEALDYVADRSVAQKVLKSGKYDLILCGEQEKEVLGYYGERAHAQMIFSHYSTWSVGDAVQGGEEVTGEKLSLTLCPGTPYDAEGIAMVERPLLRDGKLETIFGNTQFCRYLGIEPNGNYRRFRCENPGTESFAEMKKKPCLWAVAFSDFQMDSLSGHFGGEIRLAYLIDGDKVTPVTGGSVNGSLLEAQKDLRFSTERYISSGFEGPYAMRLSGVSVAGVQAE